MVKIFTDYADPQDLEDAVNDFIGGHDIDVVDVKFSVYQQTDQPEVWYSALVLYTVCSVEETLPEDEEIIGDEE